MANRIGAAFNQAPRRSAQGPGIENIHGPCHRADRRWRREHSHRRGRQRIGQGNEGGGAQFSSLVAVAQPVQQRGRRRARSGSGATGLTVFEMLREYRRRTAA